MNPNLDLHDAGTPPMELDDEDLQDLLLDCHLFIEQLLDRGSSGHAKWVRQDGAQLLDRLHDLLTWHRIH